MRMYIINDNEAFCIDPEGPNDCTVFKRGADGRYTPVTKLFPMSQQAMQRAFNRAQPLSDDYSRLRRNTLDKPQPQKIKYEPGAP